MNNRFKYMLMVAAAAGLSLGTTSCEDEGLDDLQGIYAAPSYTTVKSGVMSDKTKEGNLRTFVMDFTTSDGTAIKIALVCNNFYLASNTYTLKDASVAKNGNFVKGLSTVNGSEITDGSFALAQDGDNYTIAKSVLFTADGKAYSIDGSFVYSFEPDDPTAINVVKSATANADGTIVVVLSTGGYTENFNASTYQMEYSGEGNDLQIIFNTTDGKLRPGTYAPGTGYQVGYTFMNNAYEAWGIPAFEDYAGSLWYTIAKGARVPSLVTKGDIVVTKNGPLYTILLDQGKGGIYAQFTGSLSDVDPDGASNVTMMSSLVGVTNWASFGWGVNFIDIQLATGDVATSYDAATQTSSMTGNGTLLQVELYSADGKLARGEYEIAASIAEGKAQAGCDNPYSPGSPSGCYICEVKDGVAGTATFIPAGSVTVEGEGDDTKITVVAGEDTYMFTGNIGL